MDDLLLQFGGAVKALGNGRVAGYLVRFSGDEAPDLSGEFFTSQTDFDTEFPGKATVYYNHGLDKKLGKRKLGKAEVKMDDVGIWVEAQLEMRDAYEKAVYKMALDGELGWSSGSAPHLVEKSVAGKAVQILSWPLAEASLTPTPAEPRNAAIALKTWAMETPELAEVGDSVKAVHLGPYVEAEASAAALRSLSDALFCQVVYNCLYSDQMSDAEKRDKLRSIFTEFGDLALGMVLALMGKDGSEMAAKSVRELWTDDASLCLPAGQRFPEHSQSVLAAVSELTTRARGLHELRVKSGRVLSAANRERLSEVHRAATAAADELDALLKVTAPDTAADNDQPSDEGQALLGEILLTEMRLNGVPI